MLEGIIGEGERYAPRFQAKGATGYGHVVCAERSSAGRLRILDPQDGAVCEYLKRVKCTSRSYGMTVPEDSYIFRMDDAELNLKVADAALGARR